MSVSTFLLVHVFTALLPPKGGHENDKDKLPEGVLDEFFAALDVSKTATTEEIRKAYKKKSLQLHPDKVAQRGGSQVDKELAAAQYERVQEAYGVLVNPASRRKYVLTGYSPARYRFLEEGGVTNVGSLYVNLTCASWQDKTRLLVLVSAFMGLFLLQPVLICAKANAVVYGNSLQNTSWLIILIPLWVAWLVLFSCHLAFSEWKLKFFVAAEDLCWLVGFVFLATQWDGSTSINWNMVAIPFYLAIFWRIAKLARTAAILRGEQEKMVSDEYLEFTVLKEMFTDETTGITKSLEELTEEEREQLLGDLIVVTVDAETVAAALEALNDNLTEEDLELLKVTTSPEYQAAEEGARQLAKTVSFLCLYGFMFVALVATKLTGQIKVSWWVVFIPIWLYLGQQILWSMFTCCCRAVGEETIIMPRESPVNSNDVDKKESAGPSSAERSKVYSNSVSFASAEESMEAFNESVLSNTSGVVENGATDAGDETSASALGDRSTQRTAVDPSEQNIAASGDGEKDEEQTVTGDSGDRNENNDPGVTIDEEAYHAWKSAQEESEHSSMETQAKALGSCCWFSFQLMIVCLIVGKIDRDYDSTATGYNAFWILFPIFFVVGIVLCCCCCTIYGASAGSLDDFVERHTNKSGEDEADNAGNAPQSSPLSNGSGAKANAAPGASTAVTTVPSTEPAFAQQKDSSKVDATEVKVLGEKEMDIEKGADIDDLD